MPLLTRRLRQTTVKEPRLRAQVHGCCLNIFNRILVVYVDVIKWV